MFIDEFYNYSQARDNSLYVIYTSTKSYMIAPSYEMSEWVSFWFEWDLGFSECEWVLDFDLVRANGRFERWVSVCVRFSGKLLFLRICWNDSLPRNIYISNSQVNKQTKSVNNRKTGKTQWPWLDRGISVGFCWEYTFSDLVVVCFRFFFCLYWCKCYAVDCRFSKFAKIVICLKIAHTHWLTSQTGHSLELSNRNASIKSGPLRFPSFPVVDWFCLFVDLWVLPFPLEDCSVFGNFVITLI
jgi:hypothetical protein